MGEPVLACYESAACQLLTEPVPEQDGRETKLGWGSTSGYRTLPPVALEKEQLALLHPALEARPRCLQEW